MLQAWILTRELHIHAGCVRQSHFPLCCSLQRFPPENLAGSHDLRAGFQSIELSVLYWSKLVSLPIFVKPSITPHLRENKSFPKDNPLKAPLNESYFIMQESWNFKVFTGGKQNPKSPRSPAKNNDESENLKSGDAESETDGKGKHPSKHQLKSAKRADRVCYEYYRGDHLSNWN